MVNKERNKKEREVMLRDLASTIGYDFKIIEEVRDDVGRFKGIKCEVLLFGSPASPGYIKTGRAALEKVLSKVRKADVGRVGHRESASLEWTSMTLTLLPGAVLNKREGGKPVLVSKELKAFLGS